VLFTIRAKNDAGLERSGAKVKQITTGTIWHLDAHMVQKALENWQLRDLEFLLLKMLAIWFVLPAMIWGRSCALCFFRRRKGKTSR
jgi:hypothetical protein